VVAAGLCALTLAWRRVSSSVRRPVAAGARLGVPLLLALLTARSSVDLVRTAAEIL
jgi:hypothetical protein